MELRFFGLSKIPLLFMISPRVEELSDERVVVEISLNYLTRNHLGSMYFGVLAMGADCACGLLAMHHINEQGENVSLIFKDFKARFLKRPEGNVLFICEEGRALKDLVQRTIDSGERQQQTVKASAIMVATKEIVADFELTISLKRH